MSKLYKSNDDKLSFVDKFFLSYTDEEEWLNTMAEKGFHLVKKSFYRYYFKHDTDLKLRYTVEVLEHPASSPLNSDYILNKRSNGAELIASYKCRAYFSMSPSMFSSQTKTASATRKKTVATMFFAYTMFFLTSVALFVYNCVSCLNFTAQNSSETMSYLSQEFAIFMGIENLSELIHLDKLLGNYQSTPLVLMFFIFVVAFSIPMAVYLRELFLIRKTRKK